MRPLNPLGHEFMNAGATDSDSLCAGPSYLFPRRSLGSQASRPSTVPPAGTYSSAT